MLIYTSGTTGNPKGALIPHRALIGNLSGFVASQNWFGFDGKKNATSKAVFWSPADVVSGYDYYAEAVAQYAEGAAFPALLCVGFDMSTIAIVQTTGLAWLCDQELTFTHPQQPAHEAMRYVARLVHDLATQGAYDRALELPGLHADEVVVVTPSPDQGTVNARLVTGKEAINSTQ